MIRARLPLPPAGTRVLAAAGLASSLGSGTYLTFSVVYYSRQLGLPPADIGRALGVAGAVGLLSALPAGRLADRVGARRAAVAFAVAELAGATGLWTARGLTSLTAFSCLLLVGERGGNVAWQALVAELVASTDRTRTMAYLRSLANAGLLVGSSLAAVPLAVGTRAAFQWLFLVWITAIGTTVVLMACIRRRPHQPPVHRQPVLSGVRDLPYLTVALLSGTMSMAAAVLTIGLPLWIAGYLGISRAWIGWLLGLNTVLVVLAQVRVSDAASTVPRSGQMLRVAGAVHAAAALSFWACLAVSHEPLVIAILVLGVVLLSFGEIVAAAAGWTLRFELADPRLQGTYGAVFLMGSVPRLVAGPLVLTSVVSSPHGLGWALLACGFLAVGTVAPVVVRTVADRRTPGRRATGQREVASGVTGSGGDQCD